MSLYSLKFRLMAAQHFLEPDIDIITPGGDEVLRRINLYGDNAVLDTISSALDEDLDLLRRPRSRHPAAQQGGPRCNNATVLGHASTVTGPDSARARGRQFPLKVSHP